MAEQVTFIKIGSVNDTLIPVEAIAVVPASSTDSDGFAARAVGVVMSLLLPPGADWLGGLTITERDFFEVRGVEYQISGRPVEWVSPFDDDVFDDGPAGFEVLLRAATG